MSTPSRGHAEQACDMLARVTRPDAMNPSARVLSGDADGRADCIAVAQAEATLAMVDVLRDLVAELTAIRMQGDPR
jgi:hypothetical protein